MVHINCLASVHEGEVYLLPGDARPDDVLSWVPVKKALDYVEESGSKKTLLLLDIAHDVADVRLGVLQDRVMEHVEQAVANTKQSLYVLCSCSPGQVARASEQYRMSICALSFQRVARRGGWL